MKRILIAGGLSDIARGFARCAAGRGDALFLAGRSAEKLDATAADLRVRGAATVGVFAIDFMETERFGEMMAAAQATMGGLDTVLIAYGTLTDQAVAERDVHVVRRELTNNFVSAAELLTMVAAFFERQRGGRIGVVTSVAGDRGRRTNYIYGAAKAGLIAFASGLRGRLAGAGVSVTDIRPGLVDSAMTAHLPKSALFAGADAVGRAIYRAMDRRADVVYVPWFWRVIMFGLTSMPESLFKRVTF